MFDSLLNRFRRKAKPSTVPATESVLEDGITQHGEDPGTIPPDNNPNPLVDDINK